MEICAEVIGGVCGLATSVKAVSTDGMHVSLSVESDCKMIQAMAAELPALNAFDEVLRKPLIETATAQLAAKHKLHTTCLAPVGILKAIEAAAGLALPSRSGIELRREE